MKAKFDFIPAYCPNCGERIFHRGIKATEKLNYTHILADYHNGQPFTCACGLEFQKAQVSDEAACQSTNGAILDNA